LLFRSIVAACRGCDGGTGIGVASRNGWARAQIGSTGDSEGAPDICQQIEGRQQAGKATAKPTWGAALRRRVAVGHGRAGRAGRLWRRIPTKVNELVNELVSMPDKLALLGSACSSAQYL
jgi:hypothetical protein